MSDIKIINDLDQNLKDQLSEIHKMLSDIIKTKNSPLSEIWISSYQLRKGLEISPRTEQNWLKEGILKKHKIRGKIFYKAEDVNNALNQGVQ